VESDYLLDAIVDAVKLRGDGNEVFVVAVDDLVKLCLQVLEVFL
jgi:hypothetical protein